MSEREQRTAASFPSTPLKMALVASRLQAEETASQREALGVRLAYWAFRVDLAKAWSI